MLNLLRFSLSIICVLPMAKASLGSQSKSLKVFQGRMNLYSVSNQDSGPIQVKEYNNPQGKVFAVTWRGANIPDLKETFGAHYDDFNAAIKKAKEKHRGHGPLQITYKNLHIELSGKMRSIRGRAWLLSELPQGVTSNDLQ